MLAARQDRRGNFMDFSGGKDKHDMGRRLFQRLEQRVECRVGEHVYFIDNVHPIMSSKWSELDVLSNLSDIVHAGIRSSIDLGHIYGRSLRDLQTVGAG